MSWSGFEGGASAGVDSLLIKTHRTQRSQNKTSNSEARQHEQAMH